MNTPPPEEVIDQKLVTEVVRVMREEHVSSAMATSLVITKSNRFFGNATVLASLAQQAFDQKPNNYRSGKPRHWSHAAASHAALESHEAA